MRLIPRYYNFDKCDAFVRCRLPACLALQPQQPQGGGLLSSEASKKSHAISRFRLIYWFLLWYLCIADISYLKARTTDTQCNGGKNQINLKIGANVADKICFGRTLKFGSGSAFSDVLWRRFPHWASICMEVQFIFYAIDNVQKLKLLNGNSNFYLKPPFSGANINPIFW